MHDNDTLMKTNSFSELHWFVDSPLSLKAFRPFKNTFFFPVPSHWLLHISLPLLCRCLRWFFLETFFIIFWSFPTLNPLQRLLLFLLHCSHRLNLSRLDIVLADLVDARPPKPVCNYCQDDEEVIAIMQKVTMKWKGMIAHLSFQSWEWWGRDKTRTSQETRLSAGIVTFLNLSWISPCRGGVWHAVVLAEVAIKSQHLGFSIIIMVITLSIMIITCPYWSWTGSKSPTPGRLSINSEFEPDTGVNGNHQFTWGLWWRYRWWWWELWWWPLLEDDGDLHHNVGWWCLYNLASPPSWLHPSGRPPENFSFLKMTWKYLTSWRLQKTKIETLILFTSATSPPSISAILGATKFSMNRSRISLNLVSKMYSPTQSLKYAKFKHLCLALDGGWQLREEFHFLTK